MPLVTTYEMFEKAQKEEYAIVGLAAYNLETVQTVVETAERLQSPVMIQTTPATINNAGIEYLTALVKIAADKASIPVALHLDHGNSIELVKLCLKHGYTSIMIDGSKLPYEENVALVRETVNLSHVIGAPVEAELGQIGGTEDDLTVEDKNAMMTDPDLAADFVTRTGLDSLAVAIGTAHGLYKGTPKLDLERLFEIRAKVSVPLVLHGASGVPDDLVRKAIELGITKINIATELKIPYANALRQYLNEHTQESDPRKYFKAAKEAYAAVVEEKICLVSSNQRCSG